MTILKVRKSTENEIMAIPMAVPMAVPMPMSSDGVPEFFEELNRNSSLIWEELSHVIEYKSTLSFEDPQAFRGFHFGSLYRCYLRWCVRCNVSRPVGRSKLGRDDKLTEILRTKCLFCSNDLCEIDWCDCGCAGKSRPMYYWKIKV